MEDDGSLLPVRKCNNKTYPQRKWIHNLQMAKSITLLDIKTFLPELRSKELRPIFICCTCCLRCLYCQDTGVKIGTQSRSRACDGPHSTDTGDLERPGLRSRDPFSPAATEPFSLEPSRAFRGHEMGIEWLISETSFFCRLVL